MGSYGARAVQWRAASPMLGDSMKSIRKLLACSLAVAAMAGSAGAAKAGSAEETLETQGWCDIVPRFCCSGPPAANARCKPGPV